MPTRRGADVQRSVAVDDLCLPEFRNGADILDSKAYDARTAEIGMLAERRWNADIAAHEASLRDMLSGAAA